MEENKNIMEEKELKEKCTQVMDILKGLTVAQAKVVLDIVIEDFSLGAVIQ